MTKQNAVVRIGHVHVNEDYELRYWSQQLTVTPEELKRAVAKVGDMADTVELELRKAS